MKNSIEITKIQDAFPDWPAQTTKNIIERIATKLIRKPRTAGVISVYKTKVTREEYPKTDEAMYILSQRFHDEETRKLKT